MDEFLQTEGIENVRVEYGFALDRDLAGKPQAHNEIVPLVNLAAVILRGLNEGTIE